MNIGDRVRNKNTLKIGIVEHIFSGMFCSVHYDEDIDVRMVFTLIKDVEEINKLME